MISEEIENYIEAHSDPHPQYLEQLERLSNLRLLNGRMCSGHVQGRLLKMLVEMIKPQRVLELGTFSGYSALCMAEGLEESGKIDTVEVDDELEDFIHQALAGSPYGSKINLHFQDAMKFMETCPDGWYDMIFIDADKRQYLQYYRECKRILRPGGYIVADNTLWDGHVVEPTSGKAPQTEGIRQFNDMVAADPSAEKVMLPLRDGLTLIRIREQ